MRRHHRLFERIMDMFGNQIVYKVYIKVYINLIVFELNYRLASLVSGARKSGRLFGRIMDMFGNQSVYKSVYKFDRF